MSFTTAQVGKPAPDFTATAVMDGRLKEISLKAYAEANHWLVLIFFPKAFSFICPTEIKAFSARLEEFLYSRTCAVAFASTDNEHCLKAWNATSDMEGGLGGVHVPLISDCSQRIARDYGVLNEEEGVAQRALFIIDPKGIVRNILINDVDVGRSVDEAIRVLDALIFKDEFGEGCPADWKKGDKGIDVAGKSRVEGALEVNFKKSWTEWARPKLSRAWSGASQRSINSALANSMHSNKIRSDSADRLVPTSACISGGNSGYHSAMSSGQQSPMISPTSHLNPMDVMMQQRMENLIAAQANHAQTQSQSVGVAN